MYAAERKVVQPARNSVVKLEPRSCTLKYRSIFVPLNMRSILLSFGTTSLGWTMPGFVASRLLGVDIAICAGVRVRDLDATS